VKPCYWLPLVSWTIYSFDSFCVWIFSRFGQSEGNSLICVGQEWHFPILFSSQFTFTVDCISLVGLISRNSIKTFIHFYFSVGHEEQHPPSLTLVTRIQMQQHMVVAFQINGDCKSRQLLNCRFWLHLFPTSLAMMGKLGRHY
jgi:hypothetical protein